MNRLYVVVRADLGRGMQLAQACHAAREFTIAHTQDARGESLVVLEAPSEAALYELARQAPGSMTWFHEADLGGQLTAVAFCGKAQRLLSSLPLAGRTKDEAA